MDLTRSLLLALSTIPIKLCCRETGLLCRSTKENPAVANCTGMEYWSQSNARPISIAKLLVSTTGIFHTDVNIMSLEARRKTKIHFSSFDERGGLEKIPSQIMEIFPACDQWHTADHIKIISIEVFTILSD